MGVYYEWDIEEVDDNGDIQDHDFRDRIKDFVVLPVIDGERCQLVLVRNVGDEDSGVEDRTWAYAEADCSRWKLPATFEDGHKVPKRYHDELSKAFK